MFIEGREDGWLGVKEKVELVWLAAIIISYCQSIDPLLMLRFRRPVSRLESQSALRRLSGDLNKQFGGFCNSAIW